MVSYLVWESGKCLCCCLLNYHNISERTFFLCRESCMSQQGIDPFRQWMNMKNEPPWSESLASLVFSVQYVQKSFGLQLSSWMARQKLGWRKGNIYRKAWGSPAILLVSFWVAKNWRKGNIYRNITILGNMVSSARWVNELAGSPEITDALSLGDGSIHQAHQRWWRAGRWDCLNQGTQGKHLCGHCRDRVQHPSLQAEVHTFGRLL